MQGHLPKLSFDDGAEHGWWRGQRIGSVDHLRLQGQFETINGSTQSESVQAKFYMNIGGPDSYNSGHGMSLVILIPFSRLIQ